MPIRPAPGPPAGFELVRQHVSGTEHQQPSLKAVLPGLQDGQLIPIDSVRAAELVNEEGGFVVPISKALRSTEPYAIYTASRDDVGQGFLKSARLTAWHYLLVEADDHVHSLVEVAALGKKQEALSYAALRPREYADMMVTAIERANVLEQAQARDYELRVLRAPDLSLLAIWLHTEKWDDDLVMPILGGKPDYQAGTVMAEDQLIKVLAVIAERRREVDDRFEE